MDAFFAGIGTPMSIQSGINCTVVTSGQYQYNSSQVHYGPDDNSALHLLQVRQKNTVSGSMDFPFLLEMRIQFRINYKQWFQSLQIAYTLSSGEELMP